MFEQLQIVNLALIDRVSLSFSKGLNILTGETGAGKSIIIKAVNLLAGGKPSADTLRLGAEEARVEALFSVPQNHPVHTMLESLGLSDEEQILIIRTLQTGGKSRAWINGSLTNLSVLTRVSRSLIGISNQHEHQSLLNPSQHLLYLDQFAGLTSLREEVRRQYTFLEDQIKVWREVVQKEQDLKARKELWLFQAQEIRQVALTPGEDQELHQRKKVLQQAEKIWEKIHQARQYLSEEERSSLQTLSLAKDLIRAVASIDPPLERIFKDLESLQWQLTEMTSDLRDYLSRLVFDPQILEQVEDRLDRIKRATAKYGPSIEEALDFLGQVEKNLQEGEDQTHHRKALEEDIQIKRKHLFETSQVLSQKRKQSALELAGKIELELKGLGMGGCRFQVVFTPTTVEQESDDPYRYAGTLLSPLGIEKGEFFMAPNVGEGLRPLARIASGGELSRILLVLKGLLSQQDSLETLIFDEVDSGIGGSLGEAVGQKLQHLSQTHQVLCITHLPQIAAFAETHFKVIKETCDNRTQTQIRLLQKEDRVEEMARMLEGATASHRTQSVARDMLRRAKKNQDAD